MIIDFIRKIFSVTRNQDIKIITILGIKIKIRSHKSKEQKNIIQTTMNKNLCLENLYYTHKSVFPQFRNIHVGRDIVIIATGPTLAKYTEPFENTVNIGLNRAYQFNKVQLDYLFMQDGTATASYIDEIDKLENIKKFYGRRLFFENYRPGVRITEKHLISKNSYEFYCYNYCDCEPKPNLAVYPLFTAASVSFPAIHFALYTHPDRIYLVGCDSTSEPYWDGVGRETDYLNQATRVNNTMLNGYVRLKEFAELYYPDVEIISVNPVGLKGIFKDIYTK